MNQSYDQQTNPSNAVKTRKRDSACQAHIWDQDKDRCNEL